MLRPIPFLKTPARRMPVRLPAAHRVSRPTVIRRRNVIAGSARRSILVGSLSLAVVFAIIGTVLALVGVLALCGIALILLDGERENR